MPPVLVTGATGAQGGAVVANLLQRRVSVRALVRNPESPDARALAARGVALVQGDFDDAASLAEAVKGAGAVFSMQMPPSPHDRLSEVHAGQNLIAAARQAGVQNFVHSSVARAGDQTNFVDWSEGRWWRDYWDSKSTINDAVAAAGFQLWVILKPAFMMDNFIAPKAAWMFPELREGVIATAMHADTRLDLIAADDIGRFAAAAIVEPTRFHGRRIDLAGDSLTMTEAAGIISIATGRAIVARTLNAEEANAAGHHEGLTSSQQWASLEGYKVDLAKARSHGLALTNFTDWAVRYRENFPA